MTLTMSDQDLDLNIIELDLLEAEDVECDAEGCERPATWRLGNTFCVPGCVKLSCLPHLQHQLNALTVYIQMGLVIHCLEHKVECPTYRGMPVSDLIEWSPL